MFWKTNIYFKRHCKNKDFMIFQGIKSAISYAALHICTFYDRVPILVCLVGWLVGWLVGIPKIIIVTYHMSHAMFHVSRAKLFCGISHFFTTIILHRMLYIRANFGSWDTSHTWFLSNIFPKKVGIYIYPHTSFHFHFWHNIFFDNCMSKKDVLSYNIIWLIVWCVLHLY